jgi:hypothetical protein
VWGAIIPGLLLGGGGLLAYRGVIKGVVVNGFPTPYLFFGIAWLGVASLLGGAALAIGEADHGLLISVVYLLLALAAFGCFAITMVSFFWLPRFLLPKWFLDWRDGATPPAWSRRGTRGARD